MRFTTPISNILQPELIIPEGYVIREATGTNDDVKAWHRILDTFRQTKYPKGNGDKVWFADYEGEPIGFESVILPELFPEVVYMWTGVFLPEHQRKGLHNAITYFRLKYARETGRGYVRVACRATLDNWWRRHLIEQPDSS